MRKFKFILQAIGDMLHFVDITKVTEHRCKRYDPLAESCDMNIPKISWEMMSEEEKEELINRYDSVDECVCKNCR